MNPVVKNGNRLRWKFEDISRLNSIGISSKTFNIGEEYWNIKVRVNDEQKQNSLAISLSYSSKTEKDKRWLCEVSAKIKLMLRSGNVTRELRYCMHEKAKILEFPSFEQWDEVIFNMFPENDSIVIDVDLNYKMYDFSKKIENFTDLTILVEGVEFYINKGFLSSKSTYFYNKIVTKNEQIDIA
ncbi:unnamed protein product [Caenorhabditis angaria]|uniref:MATH domain-containing protein n=1 Tax=Caenorhabditis angaria TaxID=860376 RepID=A0A9P1I7H8_9PELO|nr:unnamed protein product [Caenorhabditis angaria]